MIFCLTVLFLKEKAFTDIPEIEIYRECLDGVKNNEWEKTFELSYNSTLSEDECADLSAVAMRYKILKETQHP